MTKRDRRRAALLALALVACVTVRPAAAAGEPPGAGRERLVLQTVGGDIVLALYPSVAPATVAHVLRLARLGVYDSTHFARSDAAALQLGDLRDRHAFLSAGQKAALRPLAAEISPLLKHRAGAVSLVREDDTDRAEGAFAIMRADAASLDGRRTIFGHVERGLDVVEALAAVRSDSTNRPLVRLAVQRATVVDVDELSALPVRGVVPVQDPTAVDPATRSMFDVLTAGIALLTALSLASFFMVEHVSPRHRRALHLVQILVGVLLIVMLQLPVAHQTPILGAVLFAGLVAVFKLMSGFES